MAKIPKNKKPRFGNPAKAAAHANATSPGAMRAARALAAATPGFSQWLTGQGHDAEMIDLDLVILGKFFEYYAKVQPHFEPTALEEAPVRKALEAAYAFDPLMPRLIKIVVERYVSYLAQTSQWTSTFSELAAVHEAAKPTAAELYDNADWDTDPRDPREWELPDIYLPFRDRGQDVRAMARTPLWKNTVTLLNWIGGGRDTPQAWVLREEDLPFAFACLGARPDGTHADVVAGKDKDLLNRLTLYWELLRDADLIMVEPSRISVTDGGRDCLAREDEMVEAVLDMMSYFIFLSTLANPADPDADEPTAEQLSAAAFLVACASEAPPTSAVFVSALQQPDQASPEEAFDAHKMALWASEGLVTVGERVTVPAPFRELVADTFSDTFTINVAGPGAGQVSASQDPEGQDLPHDPGVDATYQLKIQVEGIEPPVWRRVELPGAARLDQLHRVIQAVFAWEDRHPHEFHDQGSNTGISYGPRDAERNNSTGLHLPESNMEVAVALGWEGSTLRYVYDFDARWGHTIAVEKVLPAATAGDLPACTGGLGYAPAEDSSGPGGWMEKLAISNDPAHPEHRDIRDWLGLAAGEAIDPRTFDQDLANERLAPLRGPL